MPLPYSLFTNHYSPAQLFTILVPQLSSFANLFHHPLTHSTPSVTLGTSVRFCYQTQTAAVSLLWLPPALHNMATMMAPLGATVSQPQAMGPSAMASPDREVLRCDHCKLVQFRTLTAICRRCKKSLEIEKPAAAPAPLALVPSSPSPPSPSPREPTPPSEPPN